MRYSLKIGILLGSIFALLAAFEPDKNGAVKFLGIPFLISSMTGIGHVDIMSGKADFAATVTFVFVSFIIYFFAGAMIGLVIDLLSSVTRRK